MFSSGHFDADGNYIANEDDEDIKDEWLDSVDWNKIQDGGQQVKKREEKVDTYVPMDPIKIKQYMVEIMKPGIKFWVCMFMYSGCDQWQQLL